MLLSRHLSELVKEIILVCTHFLILYQVFFWKFLFLLTFGLNYEEDSLSRCIFYEPMWWLQTRLTSSRIAFPIKFCLHTFSSLDRIKHKTALIGDFWLTNEASRHILFLFFFTFHKAILYPLGAKRSIFFVIRVCYWHLLLETFICPALRLRGLYHNCEFWSRVVIVLLTLKSWIESSKNNAPTVSCDIMSFFIH